MWQLVRKSVWNRALLGARQEERLAVRIGSRRLFSSKEGTPASTEEGWSLKWRIGFFSAFLTMGGAATFGYTLSTDEELLLKVQDTYPAIVKLYAPFIGVPVIEETGELDEEAYFPRDITELVGDSVQVACTLKSGRVFLIEVPADANESGIIQALASKVDGDSLLKDPLVNFSFVDPEEGLALAGKSEEDVQKAFEVKLPELPSPGTATKQELQHLLDVLRVRELEFKTQVQLGKNHGFETPQWSRALERVETMKGDVKKMIKSAK